MVLPYPKVVLYNYIDTTCDIIQCVGGGSTIILRPICAIYTPISIRSLSYSPGGALVRNARILSLLVLICQVPCSCESNIPLTFKFVIAVVAEQFLKEYSCLDVC